MRVDTLAVHLLERGPSLPDPLDPYRSVDRKSPEGRPWVLANMVAGLDGSTAVRGRAGPLSDPADQELFRHLRSLADIVLVGAETVRREGYGPVRLPEELRRERSDAARPPVPRLAVVTRSLELDWSSPAFVDADPAAPTMVITCTASEESRRELAAGAGEVVVAGDERVDVSSMLDELAARGAGVVLTEGGPSLLGELLAADALDELCLTLAPLLGGDALPVAVVPAGTGLVRMRLGHALVHDDSLFLRYERAAR